MSILRHCANCGSNHYPGSKAEGLCNSKSHKYGKHMSWAPIWDSKRTPSSDFPTDDSVDSAATTDGVPDVMVNRDGIEFFNPNAESQKERIETGYEPQYIRFQFSHDINPYEVDDISQCVGYAYAESVRGESIGDPIQDGPNSFYVPADTTKSFRSNLVEALEDFQSKVKERIVSGSPVRTTDRAGVGTKGTQLVEGLGEEYEGFHLYYG